MLDHLGIWVRDYPRSREFYLRALAPLQGALVMEFTREQTGSFEGAGFGTGGKPTFWIGPGEPQGKGVHIAFSAASRAQVDAFYEAALAAGGRDNGPPGLRPHYHPDYYGAFVFDPDGNNVEAVCHRAE